MTARRHVTLLASVAIASGLGCADQRPEQPQEGTKPPAVAAVPQARQAVLAAKTARSRGAQRAPSAGMRLGAPPSFPSSLTAPFAPRDPRALAGARTERPEQGSLDPWNAPAPQLVTPIGAVGEVLSAPRLIPVFYPADPKQAQIESFVGKLGAGAYWAPTAEYGVSAATLAPSIVLGDTPPARISGDEIGQMLLTKYNSGAFAPPQPDDILILYFSPQTTVTLPQGGGVTWESCKQFGAYHGAIGLLTGERVAYAVIPRCDGYLGVHGFDSITFATSHEVIEAATDPFGAGYNVPDWQASGWAVAFEGAVGGETADFCEFQPDENVVDPQLGALVQRYWSNAAAAAWHDPCVPAPNRPYFNALPIFTGGTTFGPFGWSKGLAIPPGGRMTIPIKLFADAKVGEWQLSASEIVNPHLPPPSGELSFSFDVPHGKAGDVRNLTIKRAPLSPGETTHALPFGIVSTLGTVKNVWWITVGQ
jgi:hypothetical protein